MPNSYKSVAYNTTGSGSNEDVYTCGVVASVVKSLSVYNSSSTTAYTITVKLYKASNTTSYEINYQSIAARTSWSVIPSDGAINLQTGDKIQVVTSQAGLVVSLAFLESSVSVSGINLAAISDVSDVAATDNQVLTWDSGTGLATWETPAAAGVSNVTGTAPITVTGTTTKNVAISAATTGAAGSMSALDKSKLDSISTGAEVNQNAFSNILAAGYAADGVTVVSASHAADSKTDTYTFTFAAPLTLAVSEDAISLGTTAEVNQNAFSNVAVAGQNTIAADSKTDTLNVAAANTNVSITTNDTTDTLTIGVANDLVLSSIATTGNIQALGSLSGASISTSGNFTANGTLTAGSAILGTLSFTGGGTSTIGPDNSLAVDPADLLIRSNGNVDVVLDYDDDEVSQAFRVKDGDNNIIFSVDEDGISIANGTSSTGAVIRLGEATTNGTNYIAIQSPAALSANTTYTLPSADGTNGQVLSTNGSGALSFVTKRLLQVTGKTVTTAAWTLVSGFYEASISDTNISATSIVNVIPDNASASVAATAGVLPRTDSSSGSVKIYATAVPSATLTLTINIFDM
jgi:hypothetical protein